MNSMNSRNKLIGALGVVVIFMLLFGISKLKEAVDKVVAVFTSELNYKKRKKVESRLIKPILVKTSHEGLEVLDQCKLVLAAERIICVDDLLSIVGIDTEFTDGFYGWSSLDEFRLSYRIISIGNTCSSSLIEWHISVPPALRIDVLEDRDEDV